jgi:hypothetical protein
VGDEIVPLHNKQKYQPDFGSMFLGTFFYLLAPNIQRRPYSAKIM